MNTEELYSIFREHPEVSTDTRAITPGSVFFALKGENFNGNEFAAAAIEKGAVYAVIDEKSDKKDARFILVDDVLSSMQKLANYHRKKLAIPVIGITGSNGKTTTKELMSAVLSQKYNVLATKGNLNNHIGVPLTLLAIRDWHHMAIIEMGANHQKEIDMLCHIAEPDFGVITNIGKAHLEGFGGIEGVKKGKSELYKYLESKGGKAFVHGDDAVLTDLAGNLDKVTYGTTKLYDIVGSVISNKNYISFQWATRYNAAAINDTEVVQTKIIGIYNYFNLLCAACVGNYFKVEDKLINHALSGYEPSNNRSQLLKTQYNTLILDHYNANPSSMSLALENFSDLPYQHKVVILGDMLELGEESKVEHLAIASLLQKKQFDEVFLVGPLFKAFAGDKAGRTFENSEELAQFLKSHPVHNAAVLVKGSRGIKLEKIIPEL